MTRGKDERHNPRRVVSKWHVLYTGDTVDIHESFKDAYLAARDMHELYGHDENLIQIEHRTEDDYYDMDETHG